MNDLAAMAVPPAGAPFAGLGDPFIPDGPSRRLETERFYGFDADDGLAESGGFPGLSRHNALVYHANGL